MSPLLQARLDAAIAQASDPVEADLLRAERVGLFAREGRLDEARRALLALRQRHATAPPQAVAAALGFAEAMTDYFSDLGGAARAKLQQACTQGASAGRPALHALCAAWLAHLDYVHNDVAALAHNLALALHLAPAEHHAARSRASLVAAMAYHHGGRPDRAQLWYDRARQHASAEGDNATISALIHNMAALRANDARCAAVQGGAGADDAKFALGAAESSGYFDDRVGGSVLPVLQAILRAQLFVVQQRPREALALYEAYLDAALRQGLARMECSLRAEIAWCRAKLRQHDAARAQAGAAVAALRPECDIDDRALTHGRLTLVHDELGDAAQSQHHAQQARQLWERHGADRVQIVETLDAALLGL